MTKGALNPVTTQSVREFEYRLFDFTLTTEAPVPQREESRVWIEGNVASWSLWIVVRA